MDPTQDPSLAIPNTPNFINPAYATPQQRAQLYQYANALMQPQPIKSGWQGLASIANALVGGYMGHQADVQEQASRANSQNEATPTGGQAFAAPASASPTAPASPSAPPVPVGSGPLMPPAAPSGMPTSGKVPDPADYPTTQAGQTAFLRDYAPFAGGRGLDPNFALRVGGAEGLGAISPQNPSGASSVDIDPKTGKPFSFGALQLNVRNGLGTEARAAGIDPADPAQANKANKFALDYMATKGLAPWQGDKAVEAYRSTLAPAPPPGAPPPPPPAPAPGGMGYAPGVPPAIAAMGAALAPRAGGAAQGAPAPAYSAGQLGAMIADPNLPPEIRAHAYELTQPKLLTDVLGNVSPVYQNQSVGPPIFHGGAPGPVIGGVAPSVLSGTPGAPISTVAAPALAAGRGGLGGAPATPPADLGQAVLGPNSPAGSVIAQQQRNEQIATQKAAWAQQNLDAQKQETALRFSAAPLYQLKGILDQNGGQLPTGVGADKVMDFGSAANFITSLLGKPLDSVDTPDKISSLQLFNKYGTQLQQAMAAGILPGNATNASLESAGHTSPGIGLSNTVNVHLIDNLTRMNDLRIKYAQDYQQHYKDHNGDMSDWNNAWVKSISGNNAIPLSKYPVRESKLPDGTPAGEYASTDPSGFHWFPKAAVQ